MADSNLGISVEKGSLNMEQVSVAIVEVQNLNTDLNTNEVNNENGNLISNNSEERSDEEIRLDTVPVEVLNTSSLLYYNYVCPKGVEVVDEDVYSWSRACWKREEQIKLWGNNGSNLRNVELRSHIACVDAVHLFDSGRYLATGSRDRSIIIWDVEKAFEVPKTADSLCQNGNGKAIAPSTAKIHENPSAHKGWIWAFTSNQRHLLSAGWDNTVRIWDKKGNFQLVAELPPQRVACLCLAVTENVVACGTYDKKVLLFDPRDSEYKSIMSYQVHKKCVLALGMDDTRIISCSEDGRAILYDIRAQAAVKTISLSSSAYPTCLSFRREDPAPLFYIGDRSGRIHLVNSDLFEIVQTYDICHKQIVQGVFHSLGSVMSCSKDGHLKIMEPSLGLNELASLKIDSELPGVHSFNNTVALAGGDSVVRLWAPIEGF